MRIVSLVPSATEIVCLLGAGGSLVGRSHECDFPADVLSLPILTSQRTVPDAEPHETHELVRELTGLGQSLYTLDTGLLARLEPDLILTQDLCSVCSIDADAVRAAVREVGARTGREPTVLSLNPQTIEGILDDVLMVGEAIGRAAAASRRVSAMRTEMLEAQDWVTPFAGHGVVVGFLEWTDPLFVAGHWTVQMIERAGGVHPWNETIRRPNAGAAAGVQQAQRTAGPSISVSAEAFANPAPEIVVVAPCGYDLERSVSAARSLMAQDWFAALPAARTGRVVATDGSAYFNRPGPRVVEAFRWMVALVQGRDGWEEMLPCRVLGPGKG